MDAAAERRGRQVEVGLGAGCEVGEVAHPVTVLLQPGEFVQNNE